MPFNVKKDNPVVKCESAARVTSLTLEPGIQNVVPPERIAEILEHAFGGLLRVADDKLSPAYLVGEFKGDGIKDIVICVQLKRALDNNDRTLPSFNLSFTRLGTNSRSRNRLTKPEQHTLGELARMRDFPFLVVLHGQSGRQFEAIDEKHKFVLMNSIAPEANRLELFHGKLRNAPQSGDLNVGPAPDLIGDAIRVTIRGVGEALYWDRAEYALYPVEP